MVSHPRHRKSREMSPPRDQEESGRLFRGHIVGGLSHGSGRVHYRRGRSMLSDCLSRGWVPGGVDGDPSLGISLQLAARGLQQFHVHSCDEVNSRYYQPLQTMIVSRKQICFRLYCAREVDGIRRSDPLRGAYSSVVFRRLLGKGRDLQVWRLE